MSPKVLRTLEYTKQARKMTETIEWCNDMINKALIERERGTAGAGKKSLTVDKAIEHTTRQITRLKALQAVAEKNDANGVKGAFEQYDQITDWLEGAERQLKALQKSQRKKVNLYEFSYELMDAIKDRVTLVDMVDELEIKKRRSGAGRYVIICPFHDEKSPSCMIYVNEDKYHCFGCQAQGDVIDFYQTYLDIEFDEALTRLCDRLDLQVMDAKQVEGVDEKIQFYRDLKASNEADLEELKLNYLKEIQ